MFLVLLLNVCGFWEVFVPTSHDIIILVGNDSFKDYLGPCKFHYSFCFFLALMI